MPSLSDTDRQKLLRLARQVVIEAVTLGHLPDKIPKDGVFAERHGVFVTLRRHHRLQGCIGVVEGDDPLGESLVRCAASAALHDPRFAPLTPEDLDELEIEISLLSPPAAIDPARIEIGHHGLLISRGTQRGLLLPQVAVEHKFTPEQFLEEVCRKAQLPRQSWRDPETQTLGFTCEVFTDGGVAGSGRV
jgi:AmmeMemoRadiSam system protein A